MSTPLSVANVIARIKQILVHVPMSRSVSVSDGGASGTFDDLGQSSLRQESVSERFNLNPPTIYFQEDTPYERIVSSDIGILHP